MTDKVTPGQAPGVDLQSLMDRLRHVTDTLTEEKLTMEEHLTLYAQGIELQKQIKAELDNADRRLVQVVGQDGVISTFDKPGSR